MDSAYQSSSIVKFLHDRKKKDLPLRLAILDIDNTFSGERSLVDATRKQLEDLGYAIIFASTRTEELMMTKKAYTLSVNHYGFTRPEPQSSFVKGRFAQVDPVTVIPKAQLDPSVIIGSTGTQLYLIQSDGGYAEDTAYTESLGMTSNTFRESVITSVTKEDPNEVFAHLATIEQPHAYEEHRIDVASPLFRLQIHFNDLQSKKEFFKAFVTPKGVKYVDDSFPQQNRIKGYFMPESGGKSHAVNHLVSALYKDIGIQANGIELLLAGDSFPDLIMTHETAPETVATCLIAGGSRLTDVFTGRIKDFAGESLEVYQREFVETDKKGFYRREDGRIVIVGDLAYPGTVAIETIAAYLKAMS